MNRIFQAWQNEAQAYLNDLALRLERIHHAPTLLISTLQAKDLPLLNEAVLAQALARLEREERRIYPQVSLQLTRDRQVVRVRWDGFQILQWSPFARVATAVNLAPVYKTALHMDRHRLQQIYETGDAAAIRDAEQKAVKAMTDMRRYLGSHARWSQAQADWMSRLEAAGYTVSSTETLDVAVETKAFHVISRLLANLMVAGQARLAQAKFSATNEMAAEAEPA